MILGMVLVALKFMVAIGNATAKGDKKYTIDNKIKLHLV